MIEFLKENWKLIVEVAVLLVSTILFICRKRSIKMVDSVKTVISAIIPIIVNDVEKFKSTDLTSAQKLEMALNLIRDYLSKELYVTEDVFLSQYKDFCITQIENTLSTPQKHK